jgi:hypothetical protein
MRIPISTPENIWSDAQSVDDDNLTLEQNHNDQQHASLVGNHIGTGVIPEDLVQGVLFDSSLSGDLLDGKAITAQAQPTDSNNGNQLEIELTHSLAAGNKTVKLIIIGLDFENNLQYDTLVFAKNEKQISSKHYRSILAIFLNDFVGGSLQSFNLGGRIVIREAAPMSLSRDPIMISQDVEPNLVFRDFFVATGGTLFNLLSTSLPSYNIDALNIKTGYKQLRGIIENDVSSQIGQKFLSTSNNIQKITLLLSTINRTTTSNLVWTGDLIVSIYALQSTILSSTDIVPNLAIDFDPTNIPLAQISLDYASMLANGVKLDTVPQPVDFIFSNTPVGSGLLIKPDHYYAITVKRAGSADTCEMQVAVGGNVKNNTRTTLFNGSVWVDVPEESLWFRVYTDAAKISDGQAYDNGNGVQITKTAIDENTGTTVDYSFNNQPFLRNDLYYAVMRAGLTESAPIQNERTGNPINSRKQLTPELALLNTSALEKIKDVSSPLLIGTIIDKNIKTSSISGQTLSASFHHYGMAGNEIVFKIIDDHADGYRYDENLITLLADLVNGKLNQAKIIPNILVPSNYYRIVKAELHTLMYGDINGDGIIDTNDLLASQELLNSQLNILPNATSYLIHTSDFVTDSGLSWQLLNSSNVVVQSGTDGVLIASGTSANFTSVTANFSSVTSLDEHKINIINSTTSIFNNSNFRITNLTSNTSIIIVKLKYTSDLFLKMLRADIDGDMIVSSSDVVRITNYVNLTPPFPATSSPANRIGTTFSAVRLTVEKYVDRADDYPGTDANRSTTLHVTPDVFLDGYGNWSGQDIKNNPVDFTIVKQLNWKEHNIVVNSNPKMVPASFDTATGNVINLETTNLNTSTIYPIDPSFDPGRNDMFVPNNLIINNGGQLTTPTGQYFKVDFEMGTISFEIPAVENFGAEKSVNLLTDFIADYAGTGYTRIGYKAMRFADNSLVSLNGFTNNQVRVSVGVLSFSPQVSGVTSDGYEGIIVDNRIGVSVDYKTGLLTLKFSNLYQDALEQTQNTKVQITVYLKKAGWNNTPIVIDDNKTTNLLGL